MNNQLQKVAEKEAERLYPKNPKATSGSLTARQLHNANLRGALINGCEFWQNYLAGSEGDSLRDELLDLIWGMRAVGTDNIERHINEICNKLSEHTASAVAKAVKENGWVSVETELPNNVFRVLAVNNFGHQTVGWYDDNMGEWIIDGVPYDIKPKRITHWMPLPNAPQPPIK